MELFRAGFCVIYDGVLAVPDRYAGFQYEIWQVALTGRTGKGQARAG